MATVPTQQNASSDVWPGGQILLQVQFETFLNSGQPCPASSVTIGIAAAAGGMGSGTPVATTSSGVQGTGTEGLFSYTWSPAANTTPGDYLATWTGVRASDSASVTYVQDCTVVAPPATVPAPGVYASLADYQNETGDSYTPTAIVGAALRKASRDLDRALVAAVYRHDADGMPLDASTQGTFRRACCAQAEFRLAHQDPTGIKYEYASTNVGGVNVTRAASMQGMAFFPIGPDTLTILRVDGVLPASMLVNW